MMDKKKIRESLKEASREELISIIELLLPLIDRVRELEEEVARLKNKNSKNSSLPPSRDKQSEKRKTRSLRKKSGRKSGGQPGHKGITLKMSERVDHCIEYEAQYCEHCEQDLTEVSGILVEKKQVWDIPPVGMEVTEHRRYKKQCQGCGHWSRSSFKPKLQTGPPVRYGDRLRNQVVYLSARQFVPYHRLCEAVEVLYGQKISEGTIDNILKEKTNQALGTYEQIIEQISKSKVVGVDESGCSVQSDKSWAWTWVTSKLSLIYISDNRGHSTSQRLFPNGFPDSILNSDCWRTHLNTVAKKHQICIPHLRRECQGLVQFHRSRWAKKLDAVFHQILNLCKKQRIPKKEKEEIEDRLDRLLSSPLTKSHKEIKSLQKRLNRLRECITVCLYNRQVPPDNNAAERAIRMIKLKTKISGTFRSQKGAYRFSVLRTIVDSAIKQKIHPFQALQNPDILVNLS